MFIFYNNVVDDVFVLHRNISSSDVYPLYPVIKLMNSPL